MAVSETTDRTPEGQALNELVEVVVELNRQFTVAAEAITRPAGQSLARWLVLGSCSDEPTAVAEIARRLKLTRQSVQRVADVLAADGLCRYLDNPRDRRAKLLALTPAGRRTLTRINGRQRRWADEVGTDIGVDLLRGAVAALRPVAERLSPPPAPGDPGTSLPATGEVR